MYDKLNIKSGLLWNAVNSFGRLGLNFIATIILSRMLTPSDFGTYGILLIFITISELITDSGMGGYIVKQHSVDLLDYDTLFVYNFVVSSILYVILFISAPLIADFYDNGTLIWGIRICGIVIVVQSVSIIAAARLQRSLLFKELALISIISGGFGLLVAIAWGCFIGGYFALILQSIVSVSFNTLGQVWAAKSIPHFRFDISRFKKQFAFGINLMGSTMLQSIANNVNNNIIAKIFNMNLAGVYVQSAKLQNIPTSLVQSILDKTFFPIFSRMNDDIVQFNFQSYQVSRMVYAFCFPLMSLIICFASPIILIVLGEQWVNCIGIFQILMFASFPLLIKILNRNLLKAMGNTSDIFKMELYPFFILIICMIISAYVHSYNLLVLSVVICSVVSSILSINYVSKRYKQKIVNHVRNILIFSPFVLVSLVSVFLKKNDLIICFAFLVVIFLICLIYYLLGVPEYVKMKQQLKTIYRHRK